MNRKWNLQDIRPPEHERRKSRARAKEGAESHQDMRQPHKREEHEYAETSEDGFERLDITDGNKRKKRRIVTALAVGALIVGAGFAMSVFMSGAEVTLYPKYKDATVQATFTANREAGSDELAYELLVLEAEGERQVSASGQETVSEQAEGSIMIYNEFSSDPVRLVKNTRFESPDGLIFKITESAVVPGYTTDENEEIVPGVVTAEVFADGPGEQYNIGPSRFSVPGFEGEPEYDSIYAESTDAMTGGFSGDRYIIDDAELETAKQALHGELRDALLERLGNERPAGFVVYDGAVTFAFDSLPATEYGDEMATIKERARLQVPIFKEEELAAFVAGHTVAGYEDEPVQLEDPYALTFSYPEVRTTTSDIADANEIEFNLEGSTRVVWTFDEATLKNDLAGISKKTGIPTVLSGYPAIERAEAVVRPFWAQSLPEDPEEITLITNVGPRAEE